MIFQHNEGVQKILAGQKTQTRRIVKPNHHPLNYWRTEIGDDLHIGMTGDGTNIGVVQSSGRDMWQVYNTYAVQPGRGKPAVARIRITNIRREDVREISDEDVKAEGFGCDKDAFLEVWCEMHDKEILPMYTAMYRQGWLTTQPAERYTAWALTFELVQP